MQMQKPKFIKNLNVHNAKYELTDEYSNKVILLVDYKNNKYEIDYLGNKINADFDSESHKFALGLLSRKHAVNLAEKEQLL